jgi:hypothetical protein
MPEGFLKAPRPQDLYNTERDHTLPGMSVTAESDAGPEMLPGHPLAQTATGRPSGRAIGHAT